MLSTVLVPWCQELEGTGLTPEQGPASGPLPRTPRGFLSQAAQDKRGKTPS